MSCQRQRIQVEGSVEQDKVDSFRRLPSPLMNWGASDSRGQNI